jgi:Autographiviridae endonuclease VII
VTHSLSTLLLVKRCKVCGEIKPLDDFYRSAGMRDGHRNDCKVCNLAAKAARTVLDPQANRDRVKRWQQQNPEKYRAKQRRYVESGKKAFWNRRYHLKRTYGMTLDDYDAMLLSQNGVCAICGKPRPEDRTLHVDHDHETGEIRGLLCFRCNNALGDFEEQYALFQRAADYLDRDDALAALARTRVKALAG